MLPQTFAIAATCLFALTATAAETVHASTGSFPTGAFKDAAPGAPPSGWELSPGTDAKVVEENGQRFLRLVNDKPGATARIVTKVAVPADWEGVKITAKARSTGIKTGTEAWHVAKTQTLFMSKDGKTKLTDGWPNVAEFRNDAPEWKSSSGTVANPGADALLMLEIAMFNCQGVYDLAEITLAPVTVFGFTRTADGKPDCWGKEPVEETSPLRGRVVLNGPWRFVPAIGEKKVYDATEWGLIWAPGSWKKNGFDGVAARGKGAPWQDFDGNKLGMAWYQRDITIPKEWANRAVVLDLRRVSTDALVILNGTECGKVEWPGGEVELTSAAHFGVSNDLRVFVKASLDKTEDWNLMGVEAGQVSKSEAKLTTRGIIGEVFLTSRPHGARVSDVFVQTSTRKKELKLDVELTGVTQPGAAKFTAEILGADGKAEKSFEAEAPLTAKDVQTVALAWPWPDPKLWDFKQPNLYTLHLKVQAPGLSDDYPQSFGFREFWIEGRKFFLNGTEFRLRPNLAPDQWGGNVGSPSVIEGAIRGMLDVGFNFAELWPWDHDKRGEPHYRELWAEAADRLGLPMSGVALCVSPYIVDMSSWKVIWTPERAQAWQARMACELRMYRNHPSILMWGTSANFFGEQQDQNPLYIGMKDYYTDNGKNAAGKEAMELLKKTDPTRPVFTHHGSDVGDVHTCNNYLCMLPLQEREEWLSHWAEKGEMPYIAIEFGTPLYTTFHRGRCGYGNSSSSEPLYSEWAAAYFGVEAYKKETAAYRQDIVSHFKQNQEYGSNHGNKLLFSLPSQQDIQSLFVRNTWRAWRTWGLSGGMIPWENAQRWTVATDDEVSMGVFTPGSRGSYSPTARKSSLKIYAESNGWETYPSGHALVENNSDTLAWIAGAPAFTDKTHNFAAGTKAAKQIVLINDARRPLPYSCEWTIVIAGRQTAQGSSKGDLAPAQNLLLPVEFSLPAGLGAKTDGVITLNADIGGLKHKDEFTFRVFETVASPTAKETIAVFDPAGETTTFLKGMGSGIASWDGKSSPPLLVVGRKALSSGAKVPGDMEAYARNGGRLIIFAQDPDWMRKALRMRVANYLARSVFPVSSRHPVCEGLSPEDLQNWAGESALVEPYPKVRDVNAQERYGWHWGNRGAVASCAVEKPHHTGWTPILECEWDLAYSPLMELSLGTGAVFFCGLDLEDHWDKDPAAKKLAGQFLAYAKSRVITPRAAKTVCVGAEADFKLLDSMGLVYEKADAAPKDPKTLLVVGSRVDLPAKDLEDFASAGGRMLFLARASEQGPWGTTFKKSSNFSGSLTPPTWPQTAGLSASDLRSRVGHDAWLLASGAETGADGLLGLKKVGKGVAMFCQLDPAGLDADAKTYLRYTRWRQTRVIAQLLSNLGGVFQSDPSIFKASSQTMSIALAGDWKAKLVKPLPPSKFENKPKNIFSKEAKEALTAADVSAWQTVHVPGDWERYGGEWAEADGEAVFRATIDIPQEWAGADLELSLGTIDDYDDTFWNGDQIGGVESGDGWNVKRVYFIPASQVKPGKNEIAVRVFDHFGGGGFTGRADDMTIEPKRKGAVGLYHADYRKDFDYGDDPYRYYRW